MLLFFCGFLGHFQLERVLCGLVWCSLWEEGREGRIQGFIGRGGIGGVESGVRVSGVCGGMCSSAMQAVSLM